MNLAQDNVYGALDTDQQVRPNQIVYLFRDYVKCLLIPESTLPSQNIPPFKHLYEALSESTLPLRIYPAPFKTSICDPPLPICDPPF